MAVTAEANSVGERGGRSTAGILPIAIGVIPPPARSVMPVSEAQVLEALRPVQDPELHRSIVDLDMVRRIEISGSRVAVTVALTIAGCPLRAEITNRVTSAVRALDGVDDFDLDFTVLTDDERAALRTKLHGDPAATAGSQQAHGHAEG